MSGQRPKQTVSLLHLCQFLEIHARKCQRDLHLHPSFADHVGVAESVLLLHRSKDSLHRLFPQLIYFLIADGVTDILADIHVIFPYMTGDNLLVVLFSYLLPSSS